MHGDNRFVFVAPMFNASATLPQMLHSLYGQSYVDWHLVLIDDVSTEEHLKLSDRIVSSFVHLANNGNYAKNDIDVVEADGERSNRSTRITFIKNQTKKWEVANVLRGLKECKDDDIVCRLDADDWLTDLDALAYLNALYKQTGAEALWTAHRWAYTDKNISGPMISGADVYRHPWVSSHLKTFRKRLINDVPDVNFRGEDGEYIRRAGDQAIYLPVLHRTEKRGFVPRVMYHYTIKDEPATYQTPDAAFQRDEALFLRARGYVQ